MDFNTILAVRKFEKRVTDLGFTIKQSRWGTSSTGIAFIEMIPHEENYPIFSRDAVMYSGTIDQINSFLDGMEFAKKYYIMLKLLSEDKIHRKEQDERNRGLMRKMAE